MLRSGAGDRWIRLYSLPDGKRFATTERETSALVQRQNLVASAVLGLGARVTVWATHYGDAGPPLDLTHWKWVAEPPFWRCSEQELDTLAGARFLERTLLWTPGALDEALKLRAVDELATLTLFSEPLGSAFCPYDGGMDVLLRSPELAAAMRRLFPHWYATHLAGLSRRRPPSRPCRSWGRLSPYRTRRSITRISGRRTRVGAPRAFRLGSPQQSPRNHERARGRRLRRPLAVPRVPPVDY
jgi:hypothetical protein